MGQDAAAEFIDVVKRYPGGPFRPGLLAIDRVGLRLERGEVLGLVGPNRAGKTTLIKLLLSLSRPTAGRVRRLGRPADDRRTLARVGYVHEAPGFPKHLNAPDLLRLHGTLSGVPTAALRRRVPELIDRLGLADRAREPVARYSKGMLRRLALAQALINEPELLVLDEPCEGLDTDGQRLLADAVVEARHRGASALLVSHRPSEIRTLCDRVALLNAGRLVSLEPADGFAHRLRSEIPTSNEPAAADHPPRRRPRRALRPGARQ